MRVTGELGNCRLCRAQGVRLRAAHVLPGWAYRSPSFHDERLHCESCEARLGRHDAYVSRLAYGAGRLGLLEHVLPTPGPRPDLRTASLRGFNVQALAHFAAAVFWRAHVSERPECARLYLSEGQGETLREYLRGTRHLPSRVCLTLAALVEDDGDGTPPWTTTSFPCTDTRGDDGWHVFAVAGLAFNLSTGDTAAGIGGICLACGHDPRVVFTGWSRVRRVVTLTDALLTGARKGPFATRA
jgi:hypothetical protein